MVEVIVMFVVEVTVDVNSSSCSIYGDGGGGCNSILDSIPWINKKIVIKSFLKGVNAQSPVLN